MSDASICAIIAFALSTLWGMWLMHGIPLRHPNRVPRCVHYQPYNECPFCNR